jgi:gas vesicle protein
MQGFSKTQVAGFFLAGAGIGAVAALLFAPKAGVQVRKDIRKISRKTLNQLDDLQADIRDQIIDRYSQVKKMIKTA